jgi:small subunit ribosomal protein S5
MAHSSHHSKEPKEFDEKVIRISRVSKKTKGGNKMGFSVLMVVGDKKGQVGVGLGKAQDVVTAIRKGIKKAKKKMITVPLDGTTIPFAYTVKKGAGVVMLKPAPKGSGVIAGGPVRAVVEAAGVRDISAKILGTENQASNVYATFEALLQITKLVQLKGISLRSIADIEAEEEKKLAEIQAQEKQKAKDSKAEAKKTEPKKAPAKKEAKTDKKAAPKKAAPKSVEKAKDESKSKKASTAKSDAAPKKSEKAAEKK